MTEKQTLDETEFVFLKEEDILKASGTVMARHNIWFVVHPEKGLAFYPYDKRYKSVSASAPQCNTSKAVCDSLLKNYPWAELKFFELVLWPINPNDF